MSYIEILLGGELQGLKYNQAAHIYFTKKIDKEDLEAATSYALVYAGLRANAIVKEQEFTLKYEQICDWVDELSEETILSVINTYKETQAYKKLIPEVKEEDKADKKKSQSKSTKRNALRQL